MSLPRLKERVPSAVRIGMCTLAEHSLRFHKVSMDGSGKCDVLFTKNSEDYVVGALFEISDKEKSALDRAEGLGYGYQEMWVCVTDADGNSTEAMTYSATNTDSSLQPYSWYLYHVIHGAKETGVPADYLNYLSAINSKEDPDRERDARERAIYS